MVFEPFEGVGSFQFAFGFYEFLLSFACFFLGGWGGVLG